MKYIPRILRNEDLGCGPEGNLEDFAVTWGEALQYWDADSSLDQRHLLGDDGGSLRSAQIWECATGESRITWSIGRKPLLDNEAVTEHS